MPGIPASRIARWLGPLVLVTSACTDGPYLMYEEYHAPGGKERYVGGGCFEASSASGSSGYGTAGGGSVEALPSYAIDYQGSDDAIAVTIEDGEGSVLERRDYTDEFLRSGKVDEVIVEFDSGYLKLRYWGGETCEEPRTPDE
jgi:hypothetical protein